ncbi:MULTISPECIES: YbjN domain-containing protein [Okeania]|uniref:YbjN domain-containing protein n=1 Tax=Okeania hirsuta TaxID=1458930 RepID=A0A3N6P6Y0_9CYAN|nr:MULTISPECIES: YbjN domain-containing protein [Okeania]NEP04901.1 YbjN domain-containing protein [Okeania sp. SIO4D6]NEP38302.1 YbjN domain-containing protein [Okeania sp. SIO2H7]NEP73041.1 YbjN domain-containing protein [Okeania sp. SIO2G5]NEP90217.1 YbjN domain-containing protein [Okeania sp. SIO2C2]NEP93904.1 YbjN domain-containing protein [Okeania sp. SIO2F5]
MTTNNPDSTSVDNPSTEEDNIEITENDTSLSYIEEIETIIANMAEDQKVMVANNEAGHLWKFQYGSVEVYVRLTGETDDDTFDVWSYVLKLPAKNEPELMRRLLEMNWLSTMESHFAIVDNQIVILATRTVAELSPGEISRAITIVATLADDNDDVLAAEFGQ